MGGKCCRRDDEIEQNSSAECGIKTVVSHLLFEPAQEHISIA